MAEKPPHVAARILLPALAQRLGPVPRPPCARRRAFGVRLRAPNAALLAWPVLVALLAGTLRIASASETEAEKTDKEHSAEASERPAEMPLSAIPEPPSLELPSPRPEALEAIDGLLSRVVSKEALVREKAARELLEAKRDWVSGLSRRIDALAERADRPALKRLQEKQIERARKDGLVDESGATKDYLEVALAYAEPESEDWRYLTQLLASSRMLRHIGTTEAARELIRIYVRFGEFMRIDTQRQLEELGDRAGAALIEAQRHPAQKIASWAEKRLDLRGMVIAHEAVRTKDDEALADILVALGRSRDPDAARILISFAGTEKAQIRTAARRGIALMGEVGAWQLRDAYLDITGKHPPRDWTWKRTARELFTEYDRLRLEKVFDHYEEAKALQEKGELEAMKKGFDTVLALSPLFEQREAMAPGYVAFAAKVRDEQPDEAILALRRAERITDDDQLRKKAESMRHTLEAEKLLERGVFDRGLLDKAIALDPDSDRAREERARSGAPAHKLDSKTRYAVAIAVASFALVGAGFILFGAARRRRQAGAPEEPRAGNTRESSEEQERDDL